jgi:hypothetical protein
MHTHRHLSQFFGVAVPLRRWWCVILAARRPIDLLVQLAATLWCRPGLSVDRLRVLDEQGRQRGACLYSNRQYNVCTMQYSARQQSLCMRVLGGRRAAAGVCICTRQAPLAVST